MDDPDSRMGTWVHWVLYNIPAGSRSLPEAVPSKSKLPDGSLHGSNSWGRNSYGGPCPSSGGHRYIFKLYALDKMLDLSHGEDKDRLLRAMKGHILGQAELMGKYER